MAAAPALARMTFAEYLATEEAAPVKREWVNGEVFAMSGGTVLHGALAGEVYDALKSGLRGKLCRPFNSDVRVRVVETGLAAYPDVSVVCGPIERDLEDHEGIVNPSVLVEVLSPTTERWDRGGKWQHYRRIPSLRHHLFVEPERRRIEVFTRQDDGTWNLRDLGPGDRIDLPAIGLSLDLDALYSAAEAAVGGV